MLIFPVLGRTTHIYIYTTQKFILKWHPVKIWNSMKAVINPLPPRLQAPPSKSLCTLACGQNAHCEVDSLNRPHHHHYHIISYLHNKHHHYHHYDKVESGNTINICSCPHTVQWHQLHHHISTTIRRIPQVESNNASCRCPQGYIGDPKVRCQLKTKWYNVNV